MTPSRDFHLSATELLELFKDGDLTVETYAQSLLSRVKDRDTEVRAWAYLNPELIIAEARRLDAIPVEQRGPLHGVAVGVKDVILTKGISYHFSYRANLVSQRSHQRWNKTY